MFEGSISSDRPKTVRASFARPASVSAMPSELSVSGSSVSSYGASAATACAGRPSSERIRALRRSMLSPPTPLAVALSKVRTAASSSPRACCAVARCWYPSFILGFSATSSFARRSASA